MRTAAAADAVVHDTHVAHPATVSVTRIFEELAHAQAVRDAAHDDTRSPVVQQVAKGAVVVGEAAAAVAHAAAEQVLA
jgi:hypothetical protein